MKNEDLIIGLVVMLAAFLFITVGYDIGKRESKSEIAELKTELEDAKEQIKILEDNQILYYYADNYGGEEELEEEVYEHASQVLSFKR